MNVKLQKWGNFQRSFPTLFPSEIFEDFFSGLDMDVFNNNSIYLRKGFPKGEIFLEEGNAVIELVLAGYSKDQLSVYVEDNALVVSASKCENTDKDKVRSLKRSSFTRKFPILVNEWNLREADVSYKDGLLRISVPPRKEEREKIELTIK